MNDDPSRSGAEDLLGVDLEEMRRLGYQTVDMLIDWFASVDASPVILRASRSEMRDLLEEPAPAAPGDFSTVLKRVRRDILPYMSRLDHPRYFAYIPGFGTWPGALGDFIASAANIYVGNWREAAAASQLELTVLDWFKSWVGYPPEAAGILVSGGSAANINALACARESLAGSMSDRLVAYVSDQAHSSMARAARVLGFRPDQVRVLPVDEQYRMRPDALRQAIAMDRAAGRRPLFVAAVAGSTNTGSIDPLTEIAAICREYGVWFHVDGAYGAFAALTERGREQLTGLELADSITLDPHKWLYQPFECGCLLVRNGQLLQRAFEIHPDYLRDGTGADEEVDFYDLGLQLTRMSRALKVWMSIEYFGLEAFRATIDRCLDLALYADRRVRVSRNLELLNPAALGIVCFRRSLPDIADEDEVARVNAEIVDRLIESGVGMVSTTRLRGRFAIRLCVLNHNSTQQDVDSVLDWIESASLGGLHPDGSPREMISDRERHATLDGGVLVQTTLDSADLASLPVFASLGRESLQLLHQSVLEREALPGEVVLRQWEAGSDFFVLLEGGAEVLVGEKHRAHLQPGDFFGELAALDWGAGFSYPRLASVVATAPSRFLVVNGEIFRHLVRREPAFDEQIRRAAGERLPGL